MIQYYIFEVFFIASESYIRYRLWFMAQKLAWQVKA